MMRLGARHARPTERSSKEHSGMTLAFCGTRTHDPEGAFVVYTVRLDGEEIECAIDDAVLGKLCDAFDDPIQIFDSCHMLVLEYTRQKLCGENSGVCAHIALREQYAFFVPGGSYAIEKSEANLPGNFAQFAVGK
jgi:hypothetical protein